ncbi:MAG: diguanylate cyclase [Proteobacteria bacterium]|nr:diguanylate cyclase [Pseudomonadota bacterium]MBU1687022.1 diguanylate cyclase [Pseudomonadota bacterium]
MTISNPDPKTPIDVLIVDDDPLVLDLLGMTLDSFGLTFLPAQNGREAIDLLKTNSFSLVISDMMMPEVDGMELLKHIKTNYPRTGVIVVTGYTGIFSYTDVIRAGASDFISKPFNADELEAKINRLQREQKMLNDLEHLSNCDPLTDLYNRRTFDARLEEEVRRAFRQNYPIFLLMIDVDHFKTFNDLYGHQAGDQVLTDIGRILKKCTRQDVDLLFRYGGDEFAVFIPYLTRPQAIKVGERILEFFAASPYTQTGLSLGLAQFTQIGDSLNRVIADTITRADRALYRAKNQGRNRLVCDQLNLTASNSEFQENDQFSSDKPELS